MPLLSYTATRGWAPDAMQRAIARLESRGWVRDSGLTDSGLAARLSIEQRTDAQEQPIVAALGDRLEEVCGRLNHWGQLCIEAGDARGRSVGVLVDLQAQDPGGAVRGRAGDAGRRPGVHDHRGGCAGGSGRGVRQLPGTGR